MPLPLKNGEVLWERYRIVERIGLGGMGSIYLAEDLRLTGRRCALKEVEHDRTLPDKILQETREQFQREANVLARLDHPNLPKVSDFFSISERDYLVMDYVPGKDLRTIMLQARQRDSFLDEDDVLNWASQLADALTYLHRQNPSLVHRDVKPSNLKVTPDGLLKLVDFGLVKVLAPDEVTVTVIQGQGTLIYTPLEQYGGTNVHTDVRADIYAFGATLYHLLTNQPPADARQRFLHPESLLPPRQINPQISMRTERAILRAMELHPDDRPETVEIFRQALLGTRELPSLSAQMRKSAPHMLDLLSDAPENALFWISAGLFVLGFIATLGR